MIGSSAGPATASPDPEPSRMLHLSLRAGGRWGGGDSPPPPHQNLLDPFFEEAPLLTWGSGRPPLLRISTIGR